MFLHSLKNTQRSYKGLLAYDDDVVNLDTQMKKLREHVEGRTNSEIGELKRKIQEVSDRAGTLASREDPEERIQELEKRTQEQDQEIASLKEELERIQELKKRTQEQEQEIASLKEELERVLAAIGRLVTSGDMVVHGSTAPHEPVTDTT